MLKLEISYRNLESDPKIKDYLDKHIAKLDKYIPRHARKSAHATVRISEIKIKSAINYECEVVLQLPSETLSSQEIANNWQSAIDLVESKIKTQITKYKQTTANSHSSRRQKLVRRFFKTA